MLFSLYLCFKIGTVMCDMERKIVKLQFASPLSGMGVFGIILARKRYEDFG